MAEAGPGWKEGSVTPKTSQGLLLQSQAGTRVALPSGPRRSVYKKDVRTRASLEEG